MNASSPAPSLLPPTSWSLLALVGLELSPAYPCTPPNLPTGGDPLTVEMVLTRHRGANAAAAVAGAGGGAAAAPAAKKKKNDPITEQQVKDLQAQWQQAPKGVMPTREPCPSPRTALIHVIHS